MEEIHLLFTQTASPIFLNALDNLLAARSNSRPRSVYRTSFIQVEVTEQIVFTSLVVEGGQVISTDLA
jgi:hypothetical protein